MTRSQTGPAEDEPAGSGETVGERSGTSESGGNDAAPVDDAAHRSQTGRQDEEPEDNNTANATDITDEGKADEGYYDEIKKLIAEANPPDAIKRALRHRAARLARYEVLPQEKPKSGPRIENAGLDDRVVDALRQGGIEKLFDYQFKAIRAILDDQSVVIEAPTAFGKTEAFLAPIAQRAISSHTSGVFALLVYPTKALGRDQLSKISPMAEALGMRASIIDGNTPEAERNSLMRNPPEFLLTNFDTIHHHLFRHKQLAGMLDSLEFLVVDETHYYAGVFGANAHYIIARLKRIASPSLKCVGASATLKNSGEFCSMLFGQNMIPIKESGRKSAVDLAMMAPVGIPKHWLMVDLAKSLINSGKKIMVFSNTHRNVELVGRYAMSEGLMAEIHRGGMSDEHLDRTEEAFRSDRLDMLSCTPTLELGMDIGGVDGVISEIVPVNRFMQRMGRAGRGGERGCAFLVLGDDPISQYYIDHPDEFMRDEWVPHVDITNPDIEDAHTIAAALDCPLDGDAIKSRKESISRCRTANWLEPADVTLRATKWGRIKVIKHKVRGIEDAITIHLDGKFVGERNLPMALSELHEGAIYMLGGRPYKVVHLDYPQSKSASVVAMHPKTDEHTRALGNEWAEDFGMIKARQCFEMNVDFCHLRITKTIDRYMHYTNQGLDFKKLDKQLRHKFKTKGIKFRAAVPTNTIQRTMSKNVDLESYHAVMHLVANASRMLAGAAMSDIDGALNRDTLTHNCGHDGLIFIYDNIKGGNGISGILYDRMEKVLQRAYDMVASCPCNKTEGCPHCTLSHICRSNNAGLNKIGALESLEKMIGA